MPENKIEKSVGAILKETRLSKNISLEDASKYTKIHLNILKSIESDDFASLGVIYAKSFLRLYAEYLGLSKDDIVRRFQALSGNGETVRRPKITSSTDSGPNPKAIALHPGFIVRLLRVINFKLVLAVFFALAAIILFSKITKNHAKKNVSVEKVKVNVKKPSVKQAVVLPKAKVSKALPVPAIVAESLKSVEVKRSSVVQQKPQASSLRSQEKIVLVIRANETSFLQVKVDGSTVFEHTLSKRAVETYKANEKIELWLGNAGAVELELNGKLLGKIGRPGQMLRHVVLTRAGLSIKR